MRTWSLVLCASLLVACADGGDPQTGGGGVGGSGGEAGGALGGGGSGPVGDAIPRGAVAFFQLEACPVGWLAMEEANGRTLLPTIGTSVGATRGDPIESGVAPTHEHAIEATFTVPGVSYAGVVGGGNSGVGAAGDVTMTTTTDPASANLPTLQLLVCKKSEPEVAGARPIPPGTRIFFDKPSCPEGWIQTPSTQGRYVVGLPNGAPSDVAFGGGPFSTETPPTHTHDNDADLVTTPHGIALASGCCGDGYAQNGTHSASADAASAEPALPWIELFHCEKVAD